MRYQRSGREQKGWILDEFCAATGYNRKYAIKLLGGSTLALERYVRLTRSSGRRGLFLWPGRA